MKRFLLSTAAAGMALSLIGAPLAMAEQDQHGGAPAHASQQGHAAPQMQHTQSHAAPTQHLAVQHNMMQPGTQHENAMRAPVAHQAPMAHEEYHGAPQQHAMSQGGGHQWHSGDHYSGSRNYVSNWNQYHLRQPPQGYEWVQDGGEFVLVAVASGIIADVILNSTYQ